MTEHEDSESYDNRKDLQPKRAQRTKFREFDDNDELGAKRDKRASKRSHRQKTIKDGFWPDNDD